jgi:hypothetical protein
MEILGVLELTNLPAGGAVQYFATGGGRSISAFEKAYVLASVRIVAANTVTLTAQVSVDGVDWFDVSLVSMVAGADGHTRVANLAVAANVDGALFFIDTPAPHVRIGAANNAVAGVATVEGYLITTD